MAILSQCIQHILLKIHQYRVQILYKPGPEIFIAHWLFWHNHKEGKDEPIQHMDIRVDTIQTHNRHSRVYIHIADSTDNGAG